MMTDHDPLKNYDPNREAHHRINQTMAQIGAPVVMPENWSEIDSMADAMSRNTYYRISELDSHPDAQALAQETITNYRISIGFAHKNIGVAGHSGETEIGRHKGPQYNPNDQASMNRLYGILACRPETLIPLSVDYDWKDVVAEYLAEYRTCDVRITRGCERDNANQVFAVKSGEFVCIYTGCKFCRDWFDLDQFDRRSLQLRQLGDFWADRQQGES